MKRVNNSHFSDAALRQIAFFAAFSMFCATLEYLFPRPVPFFRLGLANLPIILALPLMNFRSLALLTLLKVLGQGLVNGTLVSYVFLFSLTGSFASFFLMYIVHRYMRLSYIGVSLAGALASNTVQSVFSVLFIFGRESWLILPLFYGLGFAAGLVIGFLAERISRKSQWFHDRYMDADVVERLTLSNPDGGADLDDGGKEDTDGSGSPPVLKKAPFLQQHLSTPAACITGLIALPLFLLVEHPLPRMLQVIILALLTLAAGKRLLYTYFVFLFASVVFFHLLVPQGRVLLAIGQFAVTEGALLSGTYRALGIMGFVFISLFSIRKDLALPGTPGLLIASTLRYFEQIYKYRKLAHSGGLVRRLDRVLHDLQQFSLHKDAGERSRLNMRDLPIIAGITALLLTPLLYDALAL